MEMRCLASELIEELFHFPEDNMLTFVFRFAFLKIQMGKVAKLYHAIGKHRQRNVIYPMLGKKGFAKAIRLINGFRAFVCPVVMDKLSWQ